jgi:serine-type D-Ala-D-Ala carboxypeptidase/endopeptidase (penicillin-binding protein 4)
MHWATSVGQISFPEPTGEKLLRAICAPSKIVTAWLAMEILGGDYRFETRFYLDGDRKLYVRGGGDPFLISEELAQLAPELDAAIGKEPVTGIVLDASYYPSDLRLLQLPLV